MSYLAHNLRFSLIIGMSYLVNAYKLNPRPLLRTQGTGRVPAFGAHGRSVNGKAMVKGSGRCGPGSKHNLLNLTWGPPKNAV